MGLLRNDIYYIIFHLACVGFFTIFYFISLPITILEGVFNMEKYKVTNTTITKEVYADIDGTPFIMIKGDYLNGCGFHDGAKFELLTQNDELILSKINEDGKEARKRHNRQMLNKASNLIYDFISSEMTDGQAHKAWEYMDTLFDELENQMIDDDVCTCEVPVLPDYLQVNLDFLDEWRL